MKLGVITDVHNNVTALKAVVERLTELKCDKIVCCGDIIGIGPYPEETVRFLMQIPELIAVRGNHEKYLLDKMPKDFPNEERMSFDEMEHHKWEHGLLSAQSVAFLKALPYKVNLEYEGHRIAVMHYCMDYDGHFVGYKRNPTEADLKKMFLNVEGDIILYGHDHSRSILMGDRLYVNVGSLGCPSVDKNIARAGIVEIKRESVKVDTLDVAYDAEGVVCEIDKINYPDAETIKKYFYGR